MRRTPLPDRRRSETCALEWRGQAVIVTFGFDDAGVLREVFADTARVGTDLQCLLSDWCVMASVALQHDIAPCVLSRSLARVPDPMHGAEAEQAASLIGAIMDLALEAAMPPLPGADEVIA